MATTFYTVKNNIGSTVASPHSPGGTITLADASAFPTTYPYRLSTFAPDGTPKSILAITGRTGNVLTTSGAIEGTTDVALSVGDLARLRVTAGALQDVHTAVNTLETTIAGYGDVVTHAASEFATAANLTSHTSNTSNPHSVTAAQVGAYTTAQTDTLLAGKQAAGSYVPTTTTVAGHALSSNVTITPGDIGAQAAGTYVTGTLVTTVGNPGSNTNVPSEAAVRSAIAGSGGGTVSSVGLSMPAGFSVANSPVTTTGTLAVTTALSGYVKAAAGAFSAGSIATGDIPDLSSTYKTVASLATWTGSTAITTLGTIGAGTWQGTVIGPAYLGTGVRDGTKFLRDDGAWTAVAGGGTASDLVSPLTAAEIAVSGAGSLTLDRMHVCSASSNYTVTLPAVTGNAGKFVGIRVASGATALVTVDAGTGVAIDGQQTRVLWAGESAILLCDGTNWTKVAGKSRPINCTMRLSSATPSTAQALSAAAVIQVLLNATDIDSSGLMADTANHQVVVRRTSDYAVIILAYFASAPAGDRYVSICYVNGSIAYSVETSCPGGTAFPTPTAMKLLRLNAGDVLTLSVDASGACYLYGDPTGSTCYLTVIEQPSW